MVTFCTNAQHADKQGLVAKQAVLCYKLSLLIDLDLQSLLLLFVSIIVYSLIIELYLNAK